MSENVGVIGKADVVISVNSEVFKSSLDKCAVSLTDFGNQLKSLSADFQPISDFLTGIGKASVTTFMGFDDAMKMVAAKTGATDDQLGTLTDTAKRLGATMSFTAQEVANGMTELATAGMNTTQINDSIEGIMNLARATGTNVPRACEIAGVAVNQFGMEYSQMGRIADVMTATANGSAQTLDDLGEALKYCGPAAKQANMSIEDTCKVIGLMANLGIKGSAAGNALKNMLTRISDSKVVTDNGAQIDLVTKDEEGNLLGVLEVLSQIDEKTKDWGNADKIDLYSALFGQRAAVPALGLTGIEEGGLFDKIDTSIGAAERTAQQMDAGIGGAFRSMSSAVESMAISLGDTLAPIMEKVAGFITQLSRGVSEFINENQTLTGVIAGLAAAFVGVNGSIFVVGNTITAVAKGLAGIKSLGSLASSGLALICAHPIIAGIVAVTAAVAGLCMWLSRSAKASKDVSHNMETVAERNAKKYQTAQDAMARLAVLANKEELSAEDEALAKVYIGRIDEALGDQNTITLEDGKIVGLDGVAEVLNAEQKKIVGEDLDKQIEEAKKNVELLQTDVDKLEKGRTKTKTVGFGGAMGMSGAGGHTYTETKEKSQEQINLENKLAEESERLRGLQERQSLLGAGVDAGLISDKNFSVDELSSLGEGGNFSVGQIYASVGYDPNSAAEAAKEVTETAQESTEAAAVVAEVQTAVADAAAAATEAAQAVSAPVADGQLNLNPPVAEVPTEGPKTMSDHDLLTHTWMDQKRAADYLKDIRQLAADIRGAVQNQTAGAAAFAD